MLRTAEPSTVSVVVSEDEAALDADVATVEHCVFCFTALIASLEGSQLPEPNFLDADCPLFVTWTKASGRAGTHQQLRGCIGTLAPRPLHVALRDYALTSAFRDSRFPPIEQREVGALTCTVSLLRSFEPAAHWQDWEVGRHGLIAEFKDPAMRVKRSATFLPEVAAEQQWDQQQCIDALIRKSGYQGAITSTLRDSLSLTRYQSTKARLSYLDYEAMHAF